jgi:hypothetical protein
MVASDPLGKVGEAAGALGDPPPSKVGADIVVDGLPSDAAQPPVAKASPTSAMPSVVRMPLVSLAARRIGPEHLFGSCADW